MLVHVQPISWRVPPLLAVLKLGGAAALALLAWAAGRPEAATWIVTGLAVLALTVWAVRDLVMPVRLSADPDGLTVITGFAGRRRLTWRDIEAVRLDRRARLGLRTELLEVDAGESVHLFGRYDLGAEPRDVLDALTALRT
jgi:hypothetical protein